MRYLVQALVGLALAITGVQVQALELTPADCTVAYPCYQGTTPNNPDAADVSSIVGVTVEEYYKQNVGGGEEGSFAGSYSTTFDNTPTDPQDATITYVPGTTALTCPECFLLIKDGNQDPIWYIFDIGDTWNGTDTITLTGFWPNQGAISHVSLLGAPGQVPEPGPLALLAIGLLAVGMRKLKKA